MKPKDPLLDVFKLSVSGIQNFGSVGRIVLMDRESLDKRKWKWTLLFQIAKLSCSGWSILPTEELPTRTVNVCDGKPHNLPSGQPRTT